MGKILSLLLLFVALETTAKPLDMHTLSVENMDFLKLHTINMDYSRAYPDKPMIYQGILMKSLFMHWGVKPDQIVELIARDQFSVFVPARLFFQDGVHDSIAWLIKEPQDGWPQLTNGTKSTAGPFQVIWTNPGHSHISDEYWAWSVTHIAIHQTYPAGALISAPESHDTSVIHGHQIYISHCASCHTINHIGKATIGPDLGKTQNPLRYYPSRVQLKEFIRDPGKFRKGRMSGSSQEGLNDQELEHLIDYFRYLDG